MTSLAPSHRPGSQGLEKRRGSPTTRYAFLVGAATCLSVLTPGQALAQDIAGTFFARDRNVSVQERPRPGYGPLGIRSGAFIVLPRFTTEAEATDNLYATSTAQESDMILRLRPAVSAGSTWSRHSLSASARADVALHAENSRENTENYGVGVNGRLDVVRGANIYGGLTYDRLTESRIAPTANFDVVKPNEYSVFQANVGGVRMVNRMRVSGRLDYSSYDFAANVLRSGASLTEDDRDYSVVAASGRVEYALSPATALFVSARADDRNYRLTRSIGGVSRDSNGQGFTIGTSLDLTRLVRGEFQVGYMRQAFSDPRFSTFSGVALGGRLEFFPTELTTLTASADRTVQEATAANAAAFVTTSLSLRADHELLRNLLLNASITHSSDSYQEALGVQERRDKRLVLSAGATYLMNRRTAVTLGYDRYTLKSDVSRGYTINRAHLSLVLQL